MTYRGFNRAAYRTILNLHPAPFRESFSREMLWIFDETLPEVGMRRLVADALSSLLKQWVATDTVPPSVSCPNQFAHAGPLRVATLAQATMIASLALLGFLTLLQEKVPLPQPPRTFEVRRAPLDLRQECKMTPAQHER